MPERALRVAHVIQGMEAGGAEKLLVDFARHADRDRFALEFVSLGSRGFVGEMLEAEGWPVHAMEAPSRMRPGLVRRLRDLFRSHRIDVVHTHNNRPLYHAAPAARWAGVAGVVHTRHGQLFGKSRRERLGFSAMARLVDAVVCVSGDAAALSVGGGVPRRKVRTVLNGTDLDRFAWQGPQAGGPAVAVGRLSPEKGFGDLLEAVARVAKQVADFRLEVAGDGAERAALEARAAELGIADRVTWLGRVRDVPAVLATARLFVLPSHTEGIALTLLEAMATGLPVVATAVGGTPEVLGNSGAGRLVPPNDPPALAEALITAWREPDGGRGRGEAGRARVLEAFDARRMVGDYERLYAEAAGARVGRRGRAEEIGAGDLRR